MYITKHDRELIGYINDYCNKNNLPKGFNAWLDSYKINLGLKSKDECTCTICNKKFYTKSKINEYVVCPKCKNKLLIKRSAIKAETIGKISN